MGILFKRKRESGEVEAELPAAGLISLTDVNASLVKIFVLTIPLALESGLFISRSVATRIRRPVVQKQIKKDVKVSIHIRADGVIELNKKPVTQEQLEDLVPKLLARSVEKNALLSADPEVVYEDVVAMIDFLKQKGAGDVLILKRKSKPKKEK